MNDNEKEFVNKEINKLNISLEILNYFVNVPIGSVFIFFYLKAYSDKFFSLLIAIVIALLVTLVIFPFYRSKKLKELIEIISKMKSDLGIK